MNAPATPQDFEPARPSRPAPRVPARDRAAPPREPPQPAAPREARQTVPIARPARHLTRSLAEVVTGLALLVLWAWLWTTFLSGVVSPGAHLAGHRAPLPVSVAPAP